MRELRLTDVNVKLIFFFSKCSIIIRLPTNILEISKKNKISYFYNISLECNTSAVLTNEMVQHDYITFRCAGYKKLYVIVTLAVKSALLELFNFTNNGSNI